MVNDAPKIDFVGKKCKTKCVEVFSLRVAGIRDRPELGHLTLYLAVDSTIVFYKLY